MASFKGDGRAILLVFVGAIIAVVIMASFADDIFTQTNARDAINNTATGPAINGTIDLIGRELVGGTTPIVGNASLATSNDLQANGVIVSTGISSSTGLKTVQLTINDTGAAYTVEPLNVTYEYLPDGYVSNTGARNIVLLIPIFAALAILVFVLVTFIQDGSLGKLMRESF